VTRVGAAVRLTPSPLDLILWCLDVSEDARDSMCRHVGFVDKQHNRAVYLTGAVRRSVCLVSRPTGEPFWVSRRLGWVVWPPSMTMACPRTKEAASEHSQSTAAAISSGVPIRPIGSWAITAVSMMPGQMAFTRMFDAA
jgi:hypothetical protein